AFAGVTVRVVRRGFSSCSVAPMEGGIPASEGGAFLTAAGRTTRPRPDRSRRTFNRAFNIPSNSSRYEAGQASGPGNLMYHAPVPLDLEQQDSEPVEVAEEAVGADAGSKRLREAHLH